VGNGLIVAHHFEEWSWLVGNSRLAHPTPTEQVNRFHRILDATKANKKLPPIQVRPGHRGPKINEVNFDTYGGE